jgi:hypothetical protein
MKRLIKSFLNQMPYNRNLRQQVEKQGRYPAGHYYSPIPDRDEVLAYIKSRKQRRMEILDVEFNKESQFRLLNEYIQFYEELPFPEKQKPEYRYYYDNGWFTYADAIFLYCFLRKHKPKRIIEIGSGFSSAVMLDTVDGFFSHRPEITFIEPHPEDRLISMLKNEDKDQVRIIDKKIQDVPSEILLSLEAGDLLFIDSSHVVKCGSDLQLLMFDILPHLPSDIFVHFHDVFYPFEYPSEWLMKRRPRYWNENYFLRAFLSYNCEWSIYFFNDYVAFAFNDFIKNNMPLCLKNSGGSLYVQRRKKA